MQHVTCDLFSNSFNFYLQLLYSVWVCALHMTSEVAPKEINAGIYVQWTWWPGPFTSKVLWKSIWKNTATKHIMQDVWDDICCMWVCTILLEKFCIHMHCSLNDWNDLILQLLNTCSSILYTILHSSHCLLGCKLLTFLHPVVYHLPPFTFPTSHSTVVGVSYCCVLFWISCTLQFT